MTLTLDIDPAAEERLRRRAESLGVPREVAEREVIEAAQNPPESKWNVLGFILVLTLIAKDKPFSAELDQAISKAFQPFVDSLIKHGTEEQLAALLPKMPGPDAENQAVIDLLRQWREEDAALSPEEAAEAEAQFEQLKHNLNATRVENGEEPVFG